MAWYDEAVFYHIYPLGLAGAPKQNDYGEPVHRLNTLLPWVDHIKEIGGSALYIGPLFESVGHGYETTDYKKLDSRLGTNEDLTAFVAYCHEQGINVIFDGVFNHTGRDFFAFKDIQANRENSQYKDWYCNVNFWGNNEYNDGFSYDNWGGYNLLVKLNQKNPAVVDYICDVIRFWVSEFDVDGIRLDAADVLDFDFMKALRRTANEVKPDFWLMGEVIHGDLNTLLVMMKGIPLAYDKDMQEDKEAVFDAVDTLELCLKTITPMLATMTPLPANMRRAAAKGFINATDCADYLTKKGMPFRDAYKCTGTMVGACIRADKTLEELTLDEFKQYSDLFEADIYDAIDLTHCCEGRTSYGGPTQASVLKQIADVKSKINC